MGGIKPPKPENIIAFGSYVGNINRIGKNASIIVIFVCERIYCFFICINFKWFFSPLTVLISFFQAIFRVDEK